MKSISIKIGISSILCIGLLLVTGSQFLGVKAGDSTGGSSPVIEQAPPGFQHVEDPNLKPAELRDYDGTTAGVKSFMAWSLKDSKTVPDDIKAEYADATIGEPQFVKNLTTAKYQNQQINDYYIMPLTKQGKLIGLCAVIVYGKQLAFGEITDNKNGAEIGSLAITPNMDSISSKIPNMGSRTVKSHRLVYKMDTQGEYSRGLLNPMIEIGLSDGSNVYYSCDGRFVDQSKFNSLDNATSSNLFM